MKIASDIRCVPKPVINAKEGFQSPVAGEAPVCPPPAQHEQRGISRGSSGLIAVHVCPYYLAIKHHYCEIKSMRQSDARAVTKMSSCGGSLNDKMSRHSWSQERGSKKFEKFSFVNLSPI